MYDIEITDHPARRLAAIAHVGPYPEIGAAFGRLDALCTSRNLWPKVQDMIGIYLDSPDDTPASELRSYACVAVDADTEIAPPLEELDLEAGPVAVLHYTGPYSGLRDCYQYLCGTWLPRAGRTPRDAPCYEINLNSPRDTPPEELRTDICVPLA